MCECFMLSENLLVIRKEKKVTAKKATSYHHIRHLFLYLRFDFTNLAYIVTYHSKQSTVLLYQALGCNVEILQKNALKAPHRTVLPTLLCFSDRMCYRSQEKRDKKSEIILYCSIFTRYNSYQNNN